MTRTPQNENCASMYEAVVRRYRRLQEENKSLPVLILIDWGMGQIALLARALESLQSLISRGQQIAKKEEDCVRLRAGR